MNAECEEQAEFGDWLLTGGAGGMARATRCPVWVREGEGTALTGKLGSNPDAASITLCTLSFKALFCLNKDLPLAIRQSPNPS